MDAARKIAVFVSGGGRSLENLSAEIAAGRLQAEITLVLANSAKAGARERAARLGIPCVVVDADKRLTAPEFSHAAFAAAETAGAQLVVLAGFLRLLVIPHAWLGRVLNIHPSLLPAFGGHGFYGHRVHEAVIASGVKSTGCSVHYVTNEYDAGPVLLQRAIDLRADDTPETLAARVFEEEKIALPQAIRMHLAGDAQATAARAALT